MKQFLSFLSSTVCSIMMLSGLGFFSVSCSQSPSPSTPQDHQLSERPPIPDVYPEAIQPPPPRTLSKDTRPNKQLRSQAINKSIPVILIHGIGWGRNEFVSNPYWGGRYDVQKDLRAHGFKVFTAAIGPISSNWDRAAELFAQIKGGCVDYGAAHSAKFGHDRFDKAKCYEGFYPEWDEKHPVNLIGHSMGGQTARMLVKFLEDGSPENASQNNVFTGGRIGWVKTIMTLSSPNNGSPATDTITTTLPIIKKIVIGAAALAGTIGEGKKSPFNFDLGQWGMIRKKNESLTKYIERAFHSKLWTTNDHAAYDLSTDGAAELNQFIGRSQHVIYTSWATGASYKGVISGWHYPKMSMAGSLKLTSYPYAPPVPRGLGNIIGSSPKKSARYDSTWWENDGIVPVKSMSAPFNEKKAIPYIGQAVKPGEWYDLGKLEGWDHIDIISSNTIDLRQFYRHQVEFINSL